MSLFLSSQNKLKSKSEIDFVFSKGSFLKVSGFSLVYKAQEPKNSSGVRVGFSVGKKMQPMAVDRNKTKRMLRESFRHNTESTSYFGQDGYLAVMLPIQRIS